MHLACFVALPLNLSIHNKQNKSKQRTLKNVPKTKKSSCEFGPVSEHVRTHISQEHRKTRGLSKGGNCPAPNWVASYLVKWDTNGDSLEGHGCNGFKLSRFHLFRSHHCQSASWLHLEFVQWNFRRIISNHLTYQIRIVTLYKVGNYMQYTLLLEAYCKCVCNAQVYVDPGICEYA